MKVRILYNQDETISVVIPSPQSRVDGEPQDRWLKRVFDKATPSGVEYEDIEKSDLPDSEFRDAWTKKKGQPIKINVAKMKHISDERKINAEMRIIKDTELREKAIKNLKDKGEID